MFSLYHAMSGARSRCLLQISLSFSRCLSFSQSIHSGPFSTPSLPSPFSNHSTVAVPAFAKAVIFQQLRRYSTLDLASVNENSNFIIAGLLGQKQGRSNCVTKDNVVARTWSVFAIFRSAKSDLNVFYLSVLHIDNIYKYLNYSKT